jgi:hypothetical protein
MLLWHLLCLSAVLAAGDPAVQQPIPYSHKTHLKLGLTCADCHTLPGKGSAAGFPPESKCMRCHTAVKAESAHIRKLAAYAQEGREVPWVRVYKLPDYVWFSHRRHHVNARIGCETCHGPVSERDAIVKEKPIDMRSCMACHEERNASNECSFCHNP